MSDWKDKIANIKPSARKSIHSGHHCPITCGPNMGRYGAEDKDSDHSQSDSSDGVDEVDKLIRSLSQRSSNKSTPLSNQHKRNNSLTPQSSPLLENNIGNLSKSFSKSLPASPELYPSDGKSPFKAQKDNKNSPNTSTSSQSRNNRSRNPSPREKFGNKVKISTTQPRNGDWNNYALYFIGGIILIGLYQALWLPKSLPVNEYNKFAFYSDLVRLGTMYNVNEDAILQIQSGIETTFRRKDASAFVFVHNTKKKNGHTDYFHVFVDKVANAAARFLRNEAASVSHIVVQNSDLDMNSDQDLINKYRIDLQDRGVLMVQNIENLPTKLAMAFHYYCDEHDPLVQKSAIFFTLDLANCDVETASKKPHDVVEKCLMNKWQKLPQELLPALLNRVVNVIIDVENAFID